MRFILLIDTTTPPIGVMAPPESPVRGDAHHRRDLLRRRRQHDEVRQRRQHGSVVLVGDEVGGVVQHPVGRQRVAERARERVPVLDAASHIGELHGAI